MAYRKKSSDEKLAELKEKERQLKARMQRETAKMKSQARKDDTRRKIIAGALALEHQDSGFQATLHKLIGENVERDADRALFGLDPLPDHGAADSHHVTADADAAERAIADAARQTQQETETEDENRGGFAPSIFRRAAG